MRDRLSVCTKNVHFSYNGDVYTQADGMAMGSPLQVYLWLNLKEQYCQL